MPLALLLSLVLASFPSNSKTSWMRPESFHLTIGMTRAAATEAIAIWKPVKGKNDDELVIDYAEDKSLTLEFRKDRLHAVRFELFIYLPEARKAFAEQRTWLEKTFGAPRKTSGSVLVFDRALPNVIVVVNDDARSEQGKKGLGMLAVRYYDPR